MKDISELAKNPNLISGIYNYCDRWCERCPFTARCLVYATEEDPDNDPATRDISNAAFWQKLAAIFQETKEMIPEWVGENGVDLSPSALAEAKEQKDRQRGHARTHPLARAAEEYARVVSQWFEKEFPQMEVFSDAAEADKTIGLDEDAQDYVEVIRWYQYFIAAKTIRGILSRVDEDKYLADEDPRDSDGSMKAALIAIDRSLSAWKLMGELRRENSESINKLLLDLEKLRLGAEIEFPRARDFIRPGFDENLDVLH